MVCARAQALMRSSSARRWLADAREGRDGGGVDGVDGVDGLQGQGRFERDGFNDKKKKNPLVELKFDQAHLPYLLSHYWADKMPLEELAVVHIIKLIREGICYRLNVRL